MTRIYHYDTTYEQEAEDGTVTASVELRIYYTVIPAGGDGWNEPRYAAKAEFQSAGIEIPPYGRPRQYRDLDIAIREEDDLSMWAEQFLEDNQDALLTAAGEEDEADADYAREMRDEMRAEQRREDRE